MRIRSGYSFRQAVGHLPEVISRVKQLGWTFAPLTDHMSTFGFTRWTKLCEKEGLRPIYGVEIPCVAELGQDKPNTDNWTFLAKDSLAPLHELIYTATNNPGKAPSLLYTQALAKQGLIKIAAERLQVDELPKSAASDPDFWLALAPSTPKYLVKQAMERGIRLMASSDNRHPLPEDLQLYLVALGWRAGTQTYPMHIMEDDEWRAFMAEETGLGNDVLDEAIAARHLAASMCDAKQQKAKLLVPEKPMTLLQMCQAGAVERGIDLSDPIYSERLERELRTIADKDFEDYFYILSDLITYAKKHMVVGPARGSSCGSLVCYLLNITAIDPIPYGLIFERFIDINRMDLPDIDVDFSDVKRDMVFRYAEEKYGKDRVARLGTVGMFKARSALNQAGISLQIPKWRIDKVADSIIERSSGDSRVMNSLEDTLAETDAGRSLMRDHPEIAIAARMEGHPQQSSQHAAGLLLTAEPITQYVAKDARTQAAWCDKKDSEDLNLLKIDALGLTQLSIFERTLELIGEEPRSGFLERIPLDDPGAFQIVNDHKYSGIFQITGTAVRTLAGQFKFERLDDFIAIGALARPGPLASGGAGKWVKRRNGAPNEEKQHPLLAELTKDTYGVVLYQETVMRITREIGNFSWADTAKIRKLMSARMGDEAFAAWWDKFREGAMSNGMSESDAKELWDQINSFGSWAFNKSHAVAYGIISYWCCWLKFHYPLEFAAATLDAEGDVNKQLAILRELASEGVQYTPVDVDASVDRWSIAVGADGVKRLVGPLTAIKGIGPAKVGQIMAARRSGEALKPGLAKQLANARTEVDSLFPIRDRIRELHPDLTKINIFSAPTDIRDVQMGYPGEVMIFARVNKISPKDENEEVNVQKRGGRRLTGPCTSLNLFFLDDSDEIFCKIGRYDFERIGRAVMENARTGKSLYAVKGTVPRDFRMISVKQIRYLGEMDR